MIVGIFGETGSGKSTLLKRLAASKQIRRAIIIDPLGKLGHLGVCVKSIAEFKRYWRKQAARDFRIIIQPGVLQPNTSPREVLAPFLHIALKAAQQGARPFWIIIDEVDRFGKIDSEIRAVADYGRNFGVSLVFVLRRPACVDRTLTAQADTLYHLRATEEVDLDYFTHVVGKQTAARLPALANFEAIRWTGAGKDVELVMFAPTGASQSHGTPGAAPEAVPSSAIAAERAPAPEGPPGEAELRPADCVIMGLKDLAGRFGFGCPQKFRKAILDSGRIAHRRLTKRAFMVRKSDLPPLNARN